MQVGDKILARPCYGMEGGGLLPKVEGTVVYIHPAGRFYTLEFTFPGPEGPRSFRQSYDMTRPGPAGCADLPDRDRARGVVTQKSMQTGRLRGDPGLFGTDEKKEE